MIRLGWGRIINVTTRLGTMLNAGSPTYGPSKTALEALSAIMDPVPSRGREGPESPRPSCSPRGWRRSAIHPHCGPPSQVRSSTVQHFNVKQRTILLTAEHVGIARAAARHPSMNRELIAAGAGECSNRC